MRTLIANTQSRLPLIGLLFVLFAAISFSAKAIFIKLAYNYGAHITGDHTPFCLHGLNAVYLKTHGWYRIDARSNNSNIGAQFTPPQEALAYPPQYKGETDINGIWAEPLPVVIKVLKNTTATWMSKTICQI